MNLNARRRSESFIIVTHFPPLATSLTPVLVGQTPRKLFNAPHPQRLDRGLASLPIGVPHGIEEDPHLLVQGNRCFNGVYFHLGYARSILVNCVFQIWGPTFLSIDLR